MEDSLRDEEATQGRKALSRLVPRQGLDPDPTDREKSGGAALSGSQDAGERGPHGRFRRLRGRTPQDLTNRLESGRSCHTGAGATGGVSDHFHDDLTLGHVLVHRRMSFRELFEGKAWSQLELELTRFDERDVVLELLGCEIGRLTCV